MGLKAASIILAGLFISSCAAVSAPGPDTEDPSAISLFEGGALPALFVVLPQGFSATRIQGIDSQVARIAGPSVLMNVDYGQSGGNQSCASLPNCRGSTLMIDNRTVTWIRQRKPVQIDGRTYSEQMHLFVAVKPGKAQSGGQQVGVRFSAACTPNCDVAERVALSARFV